MKKLNELQITAIVIAASITVLSMVSAAFLIDFGPDGNTSFLIGTIMGLFSEIVLAWAIGLILWLLDRLLKQKNDDKDSSPSDPSDPKK